MRTTNQICISETGSIDIGGPSPATFDAATVATLRAVSEEDEFASIIRLAKRADNPFTPANANHGLLVHTGDRFNAGTDAEQPGSGLPRTNTSRFMGFTVE
jgi:hypothetical protein